MSGKSTVTAICTKSFKNEQHFYSTKCRRIIIAILIIVFGLMLGIPALLGSGTSQLIGAEKEAADSTLMALYNQDDDQQTLLNFLKLRFQYHVDEITSLSSVEAKKYCYLDSNDNGADYYAVKISRVTIFGLRDFHATRYDSCINSYK